MNEAARNRFNGRLNGTKRAKKTFFTEVRERTGAFKVKTMPARDAIAADSCGRENRDPVRLEPQARGERQEN